MPFVFIKAGVREADDIVYVWKGDNTVGSIRARCRCIKHHLRYANVNLSFQMHKCRNSISGQSSITLQSSSVWIMVTVAARCCNPKAQPSITGHCFATETTWIGGLRADAGRSLYYCEREGMSDRQERTVAHFFRVARCGSLHFHTGTVCLSVPDNAGS